MNIELQQQICFSLPAVTEDVKWDNDFCFSVGGKMFCVASLDAPLRISFKVPDKDFEAFVSCKGLCQRLIWPAQNGLLLLIFP